MIPAYTLLGNDQAEPITVSDNLTRKQVLSMLRPGDIHLHHHVGAAADGKFANVGTTNGQATITRVSGNNSFSASDVGKEIQIEGAGPGGAVLDTSILSVEGPDNVTLVSSASATLTSAAAQWGTDNTDAWNEAISELEQGGRLLLSPGYTLGRSFDATHLVSVDIVGSAPGYNNYTLPQVGTVLVPMDNEFSLLDLVGSVGVATKGVQVGVSGLGAVVGRSAILLANSASKAGAAYIFDRSSVAGRWAAGGLYAFGVGDSKVFCGGMSNRLGVNFPAIFTRDNPYGHSSRYQTIATGFQGVGNWDFWGPEFHDQKLINAATGAGSVWLRGAINMRFWGCLLDSASAGAGNLYAQNVNGVGCSVLLIGNTFYTETPGFLPKHNLYCEAGSVLEIAGFKNSYTFGTSKKGGGGAFPFVGVETA